MSRVFALWPLHFMCHRSFPFLFAKNHKCTHTHAHACRCDTKRSLKSVTLCECFSSFFQLFLRIVLLSIDIITVSFRRQLLYEKKKYEKLTWHALWRRKAPIDVIAWNQERKKTDRSEKENWEEEIKFRKRDSDGKEEENEANEERILCHWSQNENCSARWTFYGFYPEFEWYSVRLRSRLLHLQNHFLFSPTNKYVLLFSDVYLNIFHYKWSSKKERMRKK